MQEVDNILLSPTQLAEVTNGYWKNYKNDLKISEVNHTYNHLGLNYLFVIYDDSWYDRNKSNKHLIKKAIQKGISAILVKDTQNINVDIPMLIVEDTYLALKQIALANSKLSKAKRLIVTGSFGKTAFKGQLYQLIKHQFNTYATLSSANRVVPTYCNLASLRKEHEIIILEQPVSRKNRPYRRASYVKPDILVITSIGHEHIDKHHSIQNIVKQKLSKAKALKSGGKCIIPKDDKYYDLIYNELQKYKDVDIVTFGGDESCNAYIIKSQYNNFRWNIKANIEGIELDYKIPFAEVYAPNASLAVFLSVYYLGGDILKAANNYISVSNFITSGKFYTVNYKSKIFYLYDQSKRGGIEGYESFFKTLSYLKLNKKGKKIVLTSEFVDYEDGEMKYIDNKYFSKLIKEANIDILYTVEKFQEHKEVLDSVNILTKHIDNLELFQENLINSISDDDMLCVKGIYESNLPSFIKYINQLKDISIKEVVFE